MNYRIGGFVFRPDAGELADEHGVRRLESRAAKVLGQLCRRPGEVVSREHLFETVWDGRRISENSLAIVISDLRRLFGDDPRRPRYIETLPKRGYRLIAPIEAAVAGGRDSGAGRSRRFRLPGPLMVAATAAAFGVAAVAVLPQMAQDEEPFLSAQYRTRQLTSAPGHESAPSFSPDGRQFAYASRQRGRDSDIHAGSLDGDAPGAVAVSPADESYPAWSPYGETIAFVRRDQDACAIWTVSPSGAQERKVADCRNADYSRVAWTQDGRGLIYSERLAPSAPLHVSLVNLDSGEIEQITTPPPGAIGDYAYAMSPDGETLAFARMLTEGAADLYICNMSAGDARRLTHDNLKIHDIDWTPDGRWIIISSNRGGLTDLWRIAPDGGEIRRIRSGTTRAFAAAVASEGGRLIVAAETGASEIWRLRARDGFEERELSPVFESTSFNWGPALSPSGNDLAYISNQSGASVIWLRAEDEGEPRKIFEFEGGFLESPQWSPDGGSLAFSAVKEGNADIYVFERDASALQRVTSSPARDRFPQWEAGGKSLLFSSNRSGAWDVWRWTINGKITRVTRNGAWKAAPRKTAAGESIVFATEDGRSLWESDGRGGEEILWTGDRPFDPSNWAVYGDFAVVATRKSPGRTDILQINLATGLATRLTTTPSLFGRDAISPTDRDIYVSVTTRAESDLILLEE